MKIFYLILLLFFTAIVSEIVVFLPVFVGYCFPIIFYEGIKKYINILLNIFLVYLILIFDVYFLSNDVLSQTKLIFILKKFNLIDFYFFFPLSFFLLLIFKYCYQLKINGFDILIHLVGLLIINYISEPLAELLIIREHFRNFEMSIYLIFIFYSIYIIWKVHISQKFTKSEIM